MRTEKKNQLVYITEFLSQFEMNAEMDISKNQWRSTGGMSSSIVPLINIYVTPEINQSENLKYKEKL